LDKLDSLNKRVAFKSLKRAFDPDAPLFIDYEEHLENYSGTDRAPVEHDACEVLVERPARETYTARRAPEATGGDASADRRDPERACAS
jgi:hypothetical protein